MTNFDDSFQLWEPVFERYCEQLNTDCGSCYGDRSWTAKHSWKWLKRKQILPQDLEARHFVEYSLALESGELCTETESYTIATMAGMRGAALRLISYLVKERKLLTNPFEDFTPKYPKKKACQGILKPKQVQILFSLPDLETPAGIRDRAIFEVAYGSGLRAGELAELKLESVSLNERILNLKNTKNGWDRSVPLTKSACEFLKRYLRFGRPRMYRPRVGSSLWLSFLRRPFLVHGIKDLSRRYRDRAGFHFSMHDLRRTCASHLLEGGASLSEISSLLGHRSLNSTQLYTQVRFAELRSVHASTHPRG